MHLRSASCRLLSHLALSAFFVFSAGLAHAASVSKISGKGDKLFVDFEEGESEITPGAKFLVIVNGKKRAVIEIEKVKGPRALARVLKGKAEVGGTLSAIQIGGPKKSAASSPRSKGNGSSHSVFGDFSFGVLGGIGMASQDVSGAASMTGMGYAVKAFGDMPVSGGFGLVGRAGLTQFNVKGTSGGTEFKTEILYINADLLMRYNFMDGPFVPFVSTGLGLHFPLSKTSNALEVQRISATTILFLGGGLSYAISDTMYLTGLGEYGMFPPSEGVTTSLIAVSAGIGFAM